MIPQSLIEILIENPLLLLFHVTAVVDSLDEF